jgi:hypothetical protein
MSDILDQALIEVRKLPEAEQNAAGFALLEYLSDHREARLTEEQRAEVRRRLNDPDRVLVSYEEVRRRLGLDDQ